MEPTLIFATLAAILTVAYSLPQAIKVYLSNSPKAISGASSVLMLLSSLAWSLFGYFSANEQVATSYTFLFLINAFVLALIFQKSGINKLRVIITSVILMATLAIVVNSSTKETLGLFAGIVSVLMVLPQGFKIIRQREATGVSGLSYLLLAAASLCWVIYGHLTENLYLVLPNLVVFPTATLVYLQIVKYRTANFFYQSIRTTN